MSCSHHTFGTTLLRTNDLDPVYVMIGRAQLPAPLLQRWCVAYWMFYHVGVASRIAEAKDFWTTTEQAFHEKWPRGAERRHFRTQRAWNAVQWMKTLGTPEDLLAQWFAKIDDAPLTFQTVSRRVRSTPEFGPWVAFKVADMAERVLKIPIDFADCALGIYREPVKGAALIAYGDEDRRLSTDELTSVVKQLAREWSAWLAPPSYNRPINVQEIETILCKYKSHTHGHYPVGKDSEEVLHALDTWGDLAQHLHRQFPLPEGQHR